LVSWYTSTWKVEGTRCGAGWAGCFTGLGVHADERSVLGRRAWARSRTTRETCVDPVRWIACARTVHIGTTLREVSTDAEPQERAHGVGGRRERCTLLHTTRRLSSMPHTGTRTWCVPLLHCRRRLVSELLCHFSLNSQVFWQEFEYSKSSLYIRVYTSIRYSIYKSSQTLAKTLHV
jgi:hypothetical protein